MMHNTPRELLDELASKVVDMKTRHLDYRNPAHENAITAVELEVDKVVETLELYLIDLEKGE